MNTTDGANMRRLPLRTPANENAMALPADAADLSFVTRKREKDDSSVTHKAIMIDLASWWCYTVLTGRNVRLPDEFGCVIQFLAPISWQSPLSIRLRCLVIWQDLLAQIDTPGYDPGKKRFESILDRLILLRKNFFPESPSEDKYNEVLRMIQTHKILSEMFNCFEKMVKSGKNKRGDTKDNSMNATLDHCNDTLKNIYTGSNDKIPTWLTNLVNKRNGWNAEDRVDHITKIVTYETSTLTYATLKRKLQSLLLRWFEYEILDIESEPSKVRIPELLAKWYRGIGFARRNTNKESCTDGTDSVLVRATGAAGNPVVGSTEIFTHLQQREEEEILVGKISPPSKEQLQQTTTTGREEIHHHDMPQGRTKLKRNRTAWEQETVDSIDDDQEERRKDLSGHAERREVQIQSHMHHQQKGGLDLMLSQRQRRKRDFEREFVDNETSISAESPRKALSRGQIEIKYQCNGSSTTSSMASMRSGASQSCGDKHTWSQEEDEALGSGVGLNGYGNWKVILRAKKELLGSKSQDELKNRADSLIARGQLKL